MVNRNIQSGHIHVVFVSLVFIALLGFVGFVGYNSYQKKIAEAGGSGTLGNSTTTKIRVASFNIKSSSDSNAPHLAVNAMNKNKFDVIGMQELEDKSKFDRVKDNLNKMGYGVYPTVAMKTNSSANDYNNGLHSRAIAYDKSRFKVTKESQLTFERWKGVRPQPGRIPIVWLQDKETKQEFIVMNTHGSSGTVNGYKGNGVNGPAERKAQADAYVKKIAELKKAGLPIFFTGDFNEAYGPDSDPELQTDYNKIFHCMVVKKKLMVNAYIQVKHENPAKYCKRNPESNGRIDQIFVTSDVDLVRFGALMDGEKIGTDHATVPYIDAKMYKKD